MGTWQIVMPIIIIVVLTFVSCAALIIMARVELAKRRKLKEECLKLCEGYKHVVEGYKNYAESYRLLHSKLLKEVSSHVCDPNVPPGTVCRVSLYFDKSGQDHIQYIQLITKADSLFKVMREALHVYFFLVDKYRDGCKFFVGESLSSANPVQIESLERVEIKVEN